MEASKQQLKQARQIVLKHNNYSIAFLQRTLGVGYNRAGVLMEQIQQNMCMQRKATLRLYSKKYKRFRYVR